MGDCSKASVIIAPKVGLRGAFTPTCLASITHRKPPYKYVKRAQDIPRLPSAHPRGPEHVRTAAEKLLGGHVSEASVGHFVKGLVQRAKQRGLARILLPAPDR